MNGGHAYTRPRKSTHHKIPGQGNKARFLSKSQDTVLCIDSIASNEMKTNIGKVDGSSQGNIINGLGSHNSAGHYANTLDCVYHSVS
jgi:hypothetical protein